MYYTVYKITNKINGKIYIGKHKTTNLNDGYYGSGKVIKRAIEKYGIDNFIKEYIEIFDNEHAMNVLEAKIVNPTFVANSSTYNLKNGGDGGFDYINTTGMNNKNCNTAGLLKVETIQKVVKTKKTRFASDREWADQYSKLRSEIAAKNPEFSFKGKAHSSETRMIIGKKNSEHQQGENNSQFGTCWVTNGNDNKKISKEELDVWLDSGYSRGRVLKK